MKALLSRLIPRMGWIGILLVAVLLSLGAYYITERNNERRALEVVRDLPAFSVIGPRDVREASPSSCPPDAVRHLSPGGSLVTIVPLQAGEVLRKPQVIPLSAGAQLDLLVAAVVSPVVASPGDEVLLIGTDEKETEGKELGSAVFLGERKGQIVVALHHKNTLRVAPFSATGKHLMAVRSLLPGRAEAATESGVQSPVLPLGPTKHNY